MLLIEYKVFTANNRFKNDYENNYFFRRSFLSYKDARQYLENFCRKNYHRAGYIARSANDYDLTIAYFDIDKDWEFTKTIPHKVS